MLQAKLKNGKVLTLYQYSSQDIDRLRNMDFYCPTCEERVIMKAGSKIIPHFAHYSKSNCPASEGGEGAYHEKGKLLLFNWLLSQGLNVSLETYIRDINQRADILLTINKKKIAIEYQCTKIPIKEILNRTEGYLDYQIQPIWILGANQFHRRSNNQITVNAFHLQLLHQFKEFNLPALFFYDPQTNTFIQATNLIHINSKSMFGTFSMKKLHHLTFIDLFRHQTVTKDLVLKEWKNAKHAFRLYQPKRLYGKELIWYRWLYSKGVHREHLPSIVYLPVKSQYRMNTPLWNWQSRICLDVISPLRVGAKFSVHRCHFQLRQSMSTNQFPLIQSSYDPILEYLQLLCSLNYIKPISKNEFVKCREIVTFSHIEDALAGDELLMNELSKISKTKYEHFS
ncbi:competence protein CoiA [Ornithinibacillus halotolerans]|uniref:Competence protein n=1 Tax=Ornithinibacillus halotolerans TaxID=1274357 RepID=A0A916RWU5_9BACI|nr:competence protein CoiA family protein [Ornithinibacillus halotolerans]GGA74078.1 competence protein [Ornithinibacillus halotolerans]